MSRLLVLFLLLGSTQLSSQRLIPLAPQIAGSDLVYPNGETFAFGDIVLFHGLTADLGTELWISDGTDAGTMPLLDLQAGPEHSATVEAIEFNGFLYFFVSSLDASRSGLYRTDGTRAGTEKIHDAIAYSLYGDPAPVAAGDRFFFATLDDDESVLWASDGTAAGTVPLRTFAQAYPRSFAALGQQLFFCLTSSPGAELWATDGTPEGTRALMQVSDASRPVQLSKPMVALGSYAYVLVEMAGSTTLWRTDGTVAGTEQISLPLAHPFHLVATASRLFLHGFGELWAYDDAPFAFTQLTAPGGAGWPLAVGDELFFAGAGSSYWRSDGTAAGTVNFSTNGPRGGLGPHPVAVGSKVYFARTVAVNSYQLQLWVTDGTAAGTRQVSPGMELRSSAYTGPMVAAGGRLFFQAKTAQSPESLWVSDGTLEETRPLRTDAHTGSGFTDYSVVLPGHPDSLRLAATGSAHKRELAVVGHIENRLEVWYSDGTPGGTRRGVVLGDGISHTAEITTAGANTFISVRQGYETHVLASRDGGPFWRPSQLAAGATDEGVILGVIGDRALFHAKPTGLYSSLWLLDGPGKGTIHAARIEVGSIQTTTQPAFAHGGVVYFFVEGRTLPGLWRSDGTQAGTFRLAAGLRRAHHTWNFISGAASSEEVESRAVEVAGISLFTVGVGESGTEIWRTDGTIAGTFALVEAGASVFGGALGALGAYAYFSAYLDGTGWELWRSDGTPGGTSMFLDLAAGPDSSFPNHFVTRHGRLYFTAWTAAHGREVWSTDGTTAGTRLLRDIVPGPAGSYPGPIVVWNDWLHFAAWQPESGVELWRSDGTRRGTRMVADLFPGFRNGTPRHLTPVGDKLFFTSYTPDYGRQLFVLETPSSSRSRGCAVENGPRGPAWLAPFAALAAIRLTRRQSRRTGERT